MLSRFSDISELTEEGVPRDAWLTELLMALGA
jgi:hypothetical protein